MKMRAKMPVWLQHCKQWSVTLHYEHDPDEVTGHALFDEKSKALAFVAETNWSKT